jgi:2-dehydropantoate 2-reductase
VYYIVRMCVCVSKISHAPWRLAHTIYNCVIGYNAWIEQPGVIGYHSKGPLIIGTPDNGMMDEMKAVRGIFDPAVKTEISERFLDVAHTKLVLNLTNSFSTLIGFHFYDIPASRMGLIGKLFTRQLLEGVKVVKAAGYKEGKINGNFRWWMLSVLSKLPQFIGKGLFSAYSNNFFASSMAQDIIQRKSNVSELEYLNGYLLELAWKYGVEVPVNRVVYELCREAFSKPEFTPVDAADIWERVYAKQ